MGKISLKVKRCLAMLLAVVMTLSNIDLSRAFAAPVNDWTHTGGIRYLVTKAENELGEEITVEAEGEASGVTVTGIEKPDGTVQEAEDGYAFAIFQVETNGTYDFKILVTRTEPATPSDATLSEPEETTATPSDGESGTVNENGTEKIEEETTETAEGEATPSEADIPDEGNPEERETIASDAALLTDKEPLDWHELLDTIRAALSAKKATPSEVEGGVTKETEPIDMEEESDSEEDDIIEDIELFDDVTPVAAEETLYADYIPVSVSVASISSDATCAIEWQDAYGDRLSDDITYPDDTTSTYVKLEYALSGNGTYPAGALKMVIPNGKFLIPAKDGGFVDGNSAGTSPLMIATGQNGSYSTITESKQTIYGTSWDAYLDGEDVVLINNASIQAGSYTFGSLLRYEITAYGTAIMENVQDMTKRNLTVDLYENGTKVNESNRLTFMINTDIKPQKVRLSGAEKSWYKWSEDWGKVSTQYPADQYVYAVYDFGLSLSASANQYALFDTASYTATGGTVIAYTISNNSADAPTKPISGFTDEIAALKGEKLNQDRFNHYFVFLVAYPRNDSSTWDSGLSMSMEATVSQQGGIDNAVTVSDSAEAKFVKFTYPSDSFDASGSVNRGTQDSLCLTYLNEDEPISKSYRLKANGYVHALRTQKGNLSAMFSLGKVTLDGAQLIAGEDYAFTDLSASASVSVYAEDQYGSVSQKFLNNAAAYQYKVYGSDEWITADSSYFYDSSKNITDARILLDGSQAFDYLSMTLTPSVEIYPTDHVKSIINGKSSAILAVSDQFSVMDGTGTEQVSDTYRSYTASRTLSGAGITTRPYVAYGFEGNSKDDVHINGRAKVYMRTNPNIKVKKYALTESEVCFTVPAELTVSNFTAYDSTNDQTLDISDVYKIGRTDDGDAIYRAVINFDGITTYDAYIQYEWSCSVDELNESNRLDFFTDAKAFWMRADGGDLYYNADGSGTVYMHSGASYVVRDGKNYPTTQDDLSVVQIGYSNTAYDFSAFEGIDPDHPDAQVCVTNGSGYYGTTAPSYESGYSLTVKGDSGTGFADTAVNDLSGVYTYRLKLTTGSGKTYDHILFYDCLEEAGSGLPTKGTLLSVDASAAVKKSGCTPVVYYYTGESTDVPTKDDLTGTGWTTTMPADKTKVKAIAVYFGDNYTLSANNKLYVDILMQAPSTYDKQWESDYTSLDVENQSCCVTGTTKTVLKSGTTTVTVSPKLSVSLTTGPAAGTQNQPTSVINGQIIEHVIAVTNHGTDGVGNVVLRDIVGDNRTNFTDKAIYVSTDGGEFKTLSEIGGKATKNDAGYDITIPGIAAGSTCKIKVQTTVSMGDGSIKTPVESQVSILSVAGSPYLIASEKGYFNPKKPGFSAGYGIGLFWTVKNVGNKSVFEKSEFSVTGIPSGTTMEIYRKSDCTEIAAGIYKPLAGMTPLATLTTDASTAELYPWMMKEAGTEKEKEERSILSGSIEADGDVDSAKYSIVLYCESGSMEDVAFEVSVNSDAAQSRNNRFDDVWHGFTSAKSVQLLGVKGVDKKTVHYDANGGYFENDESNSINGVSYVAKEGIETTKISKTSNASEDGSSYSGGYGNNRAITDTVTIPGAKKLNVKITYQTESTSYDWVCVYEGKDIGPNASNYSQSKSGKLGGSTKNTKTFTISGDTVKFFFRSDGTSDKYFGYYAVVTGTGTGYAIHNGSYMEPQKEDVKFVGWYTDEADEFDLNGFVNGEQKEITVYAKWAERYGTLKTGREINESVKKLVNPSSTYSSDDTTVAAFLKSDTPPASSVNTALLSTDDSDVPVIAWYEANSKNVYWYCNVGVKTQSDLSELFYKFKNITDISGVSDWDTSSMQNASSMFYACYVLENVDALSNWNTSNLIRASNMFTYCKKLTNLDGLSKWDTSNLANINSMFNACSALTECRSLKNWDTSQLADMMNAFNSCYNLTLLDLSNWNLSKVSNMYVGASFSNAAYTSKACTIICTKEVENKLNSTNSGMTTSYFTFVRPAS